MADEKLTLDIYSKLTQQGVTKASKELLDYADNIALASSYMQDLEKSVKALSKITNPLKGLDNLNTKGLDDKIKSIINFNDSFNNTNAYSVRNMAKAVDEYTTSLAGTITNLTRIEDIIRNINDLQKPLGFLSGIGGGNSATVSKPYGNVASNKVAFLKTGQLSSITHNPNVPWSNEEHQTLSVHRAYVRELTGLTKAEAAEIKEQTRIAPEKLALQQARFAHSVKIHSHDDEVRAAKEYRNELFARRQSYLERNEHLDALLKAERYKEKKRLNDNPELNIPFSQTKRYALGSNLRNFGNNIRGSGVPGRILGGVADSLGAAIINPFMGLTTAIKHATTAAYDFVKATISASAEIESLKTNLGIVFGNPTQSESMFQDISQYAVKSPFGVEQTTEMAVLLRQSGVYATDLMDTLKMIGDTAGGNADKMKRIANNYAQIVSIGKASMLDMRQFAYAGIPIYKAVSKELGVSQEQLRKMISEGKVTSDIIEKVFKDLTGVNGIFENATAKGAKTFKARLQNLKDAKQLFMASYGDKYLDKGVQEIYDGEGFVTSLITRLEEFFQNFSLKQNIENIDKNVESIHNHDNKIENLRRAMEDAQKSGNKELEAIYQKALDKEISITDVDRNRATYLSSYKAKLGSFEDLPEQYKNLSEKELEAELVRVSNELSVLSLHQDSAELYGLNDTDKDALKHKTEGFYDTLVSTITVLREALGIRKALNTLDKNELNAKASEDTSTLAQEAYASGEKNSSKKNSILGRITDLDLALENSERAKAEEEKKRRDGWQKALDILASIDSAVSDSGLVDFTKLSYEKFTEINNAGGFHHDVGISDYTEDFLNLSKSDQLETKKNLQRNLDYVFSQLNANFSELRNSQTFQTLYREAKGSNDFLSDSNRSKEWFENFNTLISNLNKEIDNLKLDDSSNIKNFIGTIVNELSTASKQTRDLSWLDKSSTAAMTYPLWKRIESSALGIPVEAITSTKDTLGLYHGNFAQRNQATKVFGAAGSISQMQSLLKYYGSGNLSGNTYQIDWKATNESVEEFALKLRTSTNIIDAWQEGLNEERQTLEKLIFSDIFQSELQQATGTSVGAIDENTPFYLNKLGPLDNKIAVNAFGEKLTTITGQEVKLNKDNELVLKENESIKVSEDQLIVTGDIYEMLKEYLKKLDEQDKNAATVKANADTLANMKQDALTSMFKESLLDAWRNSNDPNIADKVSNFNEVIERNPNYINQLANSYTKDVEQKLSKGDESSFYYSAGDFNEVFDNALRGDYYAVDILRNVFKEIAESGDKLAHSDLFTILLDLANRQSSIDSTWDLASLDEGTISNYSKDRITKRKYSTESKMVSNLGFSTEGLFESEEGIKLFDEKKHLVALGNIKKALHDLSDDFKDAAINTVTDGWVNSFEAVGETLGNVINGSETMGDMWSNVGNALVDTTAALLKQIGPAMVNCGLQIAAAGAMEHNFGYIAGGLALAAAGGLTSGLASFADSKAESTGKNDDYEKANDLKDQLAKLLEQARKDALYYEMNLRHKSAVGLNKEFSMKGVNDAIISPEGNIITTHPEDYLIATKTPDKLLNSRTIVQPNINFKVINNSSDVTVRQETRRNEQGEEELVAIIENVVGEFIASPKGDDAFGVREARGYGRTAIM